MLLTRWNSLLLLILFLIMINQIIVASGRRSTFDSADAKRLEWKRPRTKVAHALPSDGDDDGDDVDDDYDSEDDDNDDDD